MQYQLNRKLEKEVKLYEESYEASPGRSHVSGCCQI